MSIVVISTDPYIALNTAGGAPQPVNIEFVNGPVQPFAAVVGEPINRSAAGFFVGQQRPFTYAETGTPWPANINLDVNTGQVTGTPLVTSSTSGHTVTATDTGLNSAVTNAFDIVVVAASEAISFSGTIPDIVAFVGTPITPFNAGALFSGTEGPFAFSKLGAWPSWLQLDPVTGIYSGTPDTDAVIAGLQVRGTDQTPNVADSNPFSSTVTPLLILVDDTFTDVNGTEIFNHTPDFDVIGGGWTEYPIRNFALSPVTIESNEAAWTNADNSAKSVILIDSGQSDVVVQTTLRSVQAVLQAGMVLRGTSTPVTFDLNAFLVLLDLNADEFQIAEYEGDNLPVIRASTPVVLNQAQSYDVSATASGQTITATLDGANDVNYGLASVNETVTSHGLLTVTRRFFADDFSIETV